MTDGVMQVLVVGASASVGMAVVSAFQAKGARILATSRGGPPAGPADPAVAWAHLDLRDPASLDEFARTSVPAFGMLDVAVFLSGILPGKALRAYDDALMQEVMTVNFTGQAALLRRLLPQLREGAQALLVSSISGERGSYDPVYAASKGAQIAFVKSLATWLAPGLRVNAIAPGLIENSQMYLAMAPERREHHVARTPTRRLTTAEQLAAIIVDLCGPAWANHTGQVISINGGEHV